MIRTSLLAGTFAALALAAVAAVTTSPVRAETVPKPDTYICPDAGGPTAVDCYLRAVEHLYTMCRQVKSIEIIEFGYEKSDEGTNGAKTEYCVDKHKLSMTRPYQAALKEATPSRSAVDGLRALQDLWLKALAGLKWKAPETDDAYKARVAEPYDAFRERATAVRTALAESKTAPPAKAAASPKPATDAKSGAKTGKTTSAPAPKAAN
jgi:hypothetical protein